MTIIQECIKLFLMGLFCSVVALTMTRAKISRPFRTWLKPRSKFLTGLFECPYCLSHWVAGLLVVIILPRPLNAFLLIDLLISAGVIVVISTLTSSLMFQALERMPIKEPEIHEEMMSEHLTILSEPVTDKGRVYG